MNQVQPGGSLTVFPTLLSAAERTLDSHFLFDVSSATILAQHEDTTMLSARVEFTSNFPTSFDLAKIVARDGHSAYVVSVLGSYVDGTPFVDSIAFVPEPSALTLLFAGIFVLAMRKRLEVGGAM